MTVVTTWAGTRGEALRRARERRETAQRIAGQRSTLETQIQDAQRRLVPLQTALTQAESQWQEGQQAGQAALGGALRRGGLHLRALRDTSLADELLNGRHWVSSFFPSAASPRFKGRP